jgi:DNA-binding NarL/FixJ family response regulator
MLPKNFSAFIFEDTFFDLEAIKSILRKIPEIDIIGHGHAIGESVQFCEKYRPELVIADGEVHGDKSVGPNFVRTIRKKLPDTRILGLTRWPDCIATLKNAGCDFVVNKNLIENQDTAIKYLRETLLFRPETAAYLSPPSLTPEQDQILRLICEGNTEDQIAVVLKLKSRRSVKHVKDQLFNKFGADNVAQLVHLAYKTGYLRPDEE